MKKNNNLTKPTVNSFKNITQCTAIPFLINFPFLNHHMFHCISFFFFLQKDGDLFFLSKGLVSRRIYYCISIRTWTTASLRNYGKTVRSFLACVTPFAQHRVTSATLFFLHKKPFCNFILCTVIIFSYYTHTKKGTCYFFFGVK